jgi:hypothetical protein
MTSSPINFYHCTTSANLRLILASNVIDPEKATGKRRIAWYVRKPNVAWAIAHCIRRHEVGIDKLVVIKIKAGEHYMHQMAGGPMFWTRRKFNPVAYYTAARFLIDEETNLLLLETKINGSDWYEQFG